MISDFLCPWQGHRKSLISKRGRMGSLHYQPERWSRQARTEMVVEKWKHGKATQWEGHPYFQHSLSRIVLVSFWTFLFHVSSWDWRLNFYFTGFFSFNQSSSHQAFSLNALVAGSMTLKPKKDKTYQYKRGGTSSITKNLAIHAVYS